MLDPRLAEAKRKLEELKELSTELRRDGILLTIRSDIPHEGAIDPLASYLVASVTP
jgi:hypothetical protein